MNPIQNAKLCLWDDSVLYLGDSFDPEMHSHNAVQCCIALEGCLLLRSMEPHQNWQKCKAAVIGANVKHCVRNPDGPVALLYIEKASNNFRAIVDYHCNDSQCDIRARPLLLHQAPPVEQIQQFLSAMETDLYSESAATLRQLCLDFFHGELMGEVLLSPYISTVLKILHAEPAVNRLGRDLAALAGISESRLQHLFKAQMGIPIRRYVLWMRLRNVIKKSMSGASLTEAAHDSGFSDSAHFTRTFKAMFGIPPSLIAGQQNSVIPLLCNRSLGRETAESFK